MNTPKRSRYAVGSIDTDSEEDTEIDISASLTPKGMSKTHQAFAAKRMKTNHPHMQAESVPDNMTVIPTEDVAVEHPHLKENPADEKRKNQACFL
jgi:hypothetical protein